MCDGGFPAAERETGAIDVLDMLRRILGGYTPPHCRRRIWLTREVFIGEVNGLWQYALDFATESVFVEDSDLPSGPLLTIVDYEEASDESIPLFRPGQRRHAVGRN